VLREVTGINRIRMLYLQLQYRCNFRCRTCFHGELLESAEHFTLKEATALIDHFVDEYAIETVTLLGGEPLLYPDIVPVARHARSRGVSVEICTNGHRGYFATVRELAPSLNRFRVSIDGLEETHDAIRQRGSFASAIECLDLAGRLGLTTGVTMTVTSTNIDEVAALAALLDEHGVDELKLHCLRLVGNAEQNPELAVEDTDQYAGMHAALEAANLRLMVTYDSDLTPEPIGEACSNLISNDWLDRIEADPRGGLTVSCKAVGRDVNAFRFDKRQNVILYEPRDRDELAVPIADVVYVNA
jgi:MoaA/NifB/PqqE/SkfB family radical SAM enzyme